ncbi:MAG TPA: hypothetical protein VL294_07345 [Pseudolysinimonas sp.]|jgi:hypothetical protein|nr:hypothetical protein [Pseudolysinimonas sp.]
MTWVRRHRWALAALVVLIPAALAAAMSIAWFRYVGAEAQHPVVVRSGDPGTYATDRPGSDAQELSGLTATLTLTGYNVVPWNTETGREVGLLEGTEAVSALIHVDATGLPEDVFSCQALLIAPGPEGDRVWETASGEIDYYPSGDLHGYCDLSEGTAFDWEAVFVVPEGVGDDARLIISDGSLNPRYQLQLEH